jgi:hypothetical protein
MGLLTWLAIRDVGSDVRQAGGQQQKLLKTLVKQNEDAEHRETRRERQSRPDAHTEWLQHLHRETPLGHPAVQQANPDWIATLAEGYGAYPHQWSLAAIQVRRELTAAGWDVRKLTGELRGPQPGTHAGPSGPPDNYKTTAASDEH